MNVFVLNTGRCGSMTFVEACRPITNFSSAHESRCAKLGAERFAYPDNHIEADNRLSWFLGRLDKRYGDDAFYVHLVRDPERTAQSFARRYRRGVIRGYREHILGLPDGAPALPVAQDYCDTVNRNIELFLKDKTRKMVFRIESAKEDFRKFWELIHAKGDLEAALAAFDTRYNASDARKKPPLPLRIVRKARMVAIKLPRFIRDA